MAMPTVGTAGIYKSADNPILRVIDPARAEGDPKGVMGEITRGLWADFEARTVPIMKALEQYTTYNGNPGIQDRLIEGARESINTAYSGVEGANQRRLAGMGLAPTAAEQGAMAKATKMAKGLSMVDAANRTYQYQQDLNRQIASGQSAIKAAASDAENRGLL